MADEIDIAQERAQIFLEVVLSARRKGSPASWDGLPRDCEECGDPIPIERLKAVPEALACATCQAELEIRR